jgi:hypothetical protein
MMQPIPRMLAAGHQPDNSYFANNPTRTFHNFNPTGDAEKIKEMQANGNNLLGQITEIREKADNGFKGLIDAHSKLSKRMADMDQT